MKLTKHAWILWGIALAVVLVLALLIPFEKTAVYWIGLLCTVAMFGVCVFVFHRSFRRDDTLESKLLGWPIFKVGYMALFAQIIVGFLLMAAASICSVQVAVVVEVAVFAVSAFCLTARDAVREAVTATETKVTDHTATWKAIRVRAAAVAAETGHPEIRKLAEEIRYADPMPTAMDGEIAQMLEKLSSSADEESISKVKNLLLARKSLSKESKR